jgi:hypothetical protein
MKTVIEMAREAVQAPDRTDKSVLFFGLNGEQMFRFADLVRADAIADEREACAKMCDVLAVHPEYASEVTKLAAMAIRARSNT